MKILLTLLLLITLVSCVEETQNKQKDKNRHTHLVEEVKYKGVFYQVIKTKKQICVSVYQGGLFCTHNNEQYAKIHFIAEEKHEGVFYHLFQWAGHECLSVYKGGISCSLLK